jgi:hypothetical protein
MLVSEIIFSIFALWYTSAIALGVGSSSLAIAGFLTAIADGKFGEGERRIMGVIYVSLRIAMVMILATLLIFLFWYPEELTTIGKQLLMTALLFGNAFLMTKHYVGAKIGPAFQAATWYTLGFVFTIDAFGLFSVTMPLFIILYAVDILLAVVIVNGFMRRYEMKRQADRVASEEEVE